MAPGGGRQKNPVAYFYYTLPISCSENSRVYRRFSLLLQRHRWALGGGGQSWGACVAGAGWVFRRRCPFSKCRPVSHTRSGIEAYKSHWFLPCFAIFHSNPGALLFCRRSGFSFQRPALGDPSGPAYPRGTRCCHSGKREGPWGRLALFFPRVLHVVQTWKE